MERFLIDLLWFWYQDLGIWLWASRNAHDIRRSYFDCRSHCTTNTSSDSNWVNSPLIVYFGSCMWKCLARGSSRDRYFYSRRDNITSSSLYHFSCISSVFWYQFRCCCHIWCFKCKCWSRGTCYFFQRSTCNLNSRDRAICFIHNCLHLKRNRVLIFLTFCSRNRDSWSCDIFWSRWDNSYFFDSLVGVHCDFCSCSFSWS